MEDEDSEPEETPNELRFLDGVLEQYINRSNDNLDIDIRTQKARLMDETYRFLRDTYGERIKYTTHTTGHSHAGYDSAYFQRNLAPQVEVINFNPAPKGVVSADIGRSWVTPNNIVSSSVKLKAGSNPSEYNVFEVRSIENTIGNRMSGGHMMGNFTQELLNDSITTGETETTPLLENSSDLKISNNITRGFGNAAKNIVVRKWNCTVIIL